MGALFSKCRTVADFSILDLGSRHLTRDHIQMIDKFLPDFRIREQSTELHRQIAANHWNAVFARESRISISGVSVRESPYTASTVPTSLSEIHAARSERDCSQTTSKISLLLDAFYAHLDAHAPEVKPLFRSSLRVKGSILVHISAGMRSILAGGKAAEKMAELTKTHERFGVQLHHFNAMGNALMFAMQQVSDEVWTPEVAEAWRYLFAHCSAILLVLQQRVVERKEHSAQHHEPITAATTQG